MAGTDFQTVLKHAEMNGRIDAPRMHLDQDQVDRLVRAAQMAFGPPRHNPRGADFRHARFVGDVSFQGIDIDGDVRFDGAHFDGKADFSEVEFAGVASFTGVWMCGAADFAKASFAGQADFRGAQFFTDASFKAAKFAQRARYDRSWFRGNADFREASFGDRLFVSGARVLRDALFTDAAFRAPVDIGPLLVRRRLVLDSVRFDEDVVLKATAAEFSCVRARFVGRADLNLRWAEVVLDDTLFLQSSWLTGSPRFPEVIEVPGKVDRTPGSGPEQERPRLLSLRDTNVANLALADVDLRACRFERAQGLDELRLEADCEFAGTPGGWRYAQRRTLAEEQEWRARRGGHGWYEPACQPAAWLSPAAKALDPLQIAALYRSLRKALEDSKDEPGAGDFYYGEMEMRRRSASADPVGGAIRRRVHLAERTIVSVYWLLSGYGLRASRALSALLVLVALWTAAFHLYGFQDRVRPYATKAELQPQKRIGFPPTPGELLDGWASFEAWTYSAGTATAIIGAPEAQLTQAGRGMRITLRILSPLLIGLALLAIRGRVKR